MRAVATALVLIAGAAVVLWYGNTLNSWVLGGLIGGLAALLLSIPISLTLFSYLSRRHDEHLRAEEQEEISLQEYDYYPVVPSSSSRREIESYVLTEEDPEEVWREEERLRRAQRRLPAPTPQRRPLSQTSQGSTPNRLPAAQRYDYLPAPRPQQEMKPQSRETKVLRPATLSQHRSDALRAARLEAAQQRNDDEEVFPTNGSRRDVSVRPNQNQSLTKQNTSVMPQRPARQLPQQAPNRTRRVVDATSSRNLRSPSIKEENTTSSRRPEPQTDNLYNNPLPRTTPIARSPQTDQIARRPQQGQQQANSDATTGSLNRPLVRRAPYMYDDDPLRHELAQHLDTPAVRRSSRYEPQDEDEEEM